MFNIEGTVAIVTGALGGIGKVYVRALLSKNAKAVVLLDINDSVAAEFLLSLESEFGVNKAVYMNVDVTDIKMVEDVFVKTVERFGNLDIVVNNAGTLTQNNIELVVKLNLLATIQISNLAFYTYLPKYKMGEEAIILNTASVAGLFPYEMAPEYCATKHAVVAYTQSLGTKTHYSNTHVKMMVLCPGATTTNIWDGIIDYYKSILDSYKDLIVMQPVDILGESLIKVLEEGENGSVWVSKDSEPAFEFDYKRETLPILFKQVSRKNYTFTDFLHRVKQN